MWVLGLLMLACLAWPSYLSLRSKEAVLKDDRIVSIVVDYADLQALARQGHRVNILNILKDSHVSMIAVPYDLPKTDEISLRLAGIPLLWKINTGRIESSIVNQFRYRDGVAVTGDIEFDDPSLTIAISQGLRDKHGFLALIEFSPLRSVKPLADVLKDRLIRTHVITSREAIQPKPNFWLPRIKRAVQDRWVRVVWIRLSSAWNLDENLQFIRAASGEIASAGFVIGLANPMKEWAIPGPWASLGGFVLTLLMPAAGVLFIYWRGHRGALLAFLTVLISTTAAGVIVHGLIVNPAPAVGYAMPRGVKLQLLIPILLTGLFLLKKSEILALKKRNVTWGDLILIGGILVGGLGLYLMRSGNSPLLPVPDAERAFRDWLDMVLGARPRFKEFAFGHPLLIAGLYMRGKGEGFFKDGRLFVLLGLIGQISILNTFMHASAPLETSLLRTLHGAWMGAVLSVPVCLVLDRLILRKQQ